jgi:hypothetical protein
MQDLRQTISSLLSLLGLAMMLLPVVLYFMVLSGNSHTALARWWEETFPGIWMLVAMGVCTIGGACILGFGGRLALDKSARK